MMILTLIASIALGFLGVLLSIFLYNIYQMYISIREPAMAHFGFVILTLIFTFISGAIGIFLEVDQTSHPIFLFNIFVFSLHYLGVGLVFRTLNNSSTLLSDYLLLLIFLAPAFAFSLLLGSNFIAPVALLSQIVPLFIVIYMEKSLAKQFTLSQAYLENQQEKEIVKIFAKIFKTGLFIHSIGIFAFGVFTIYFLTGNAAEIEQIWVEEWQIFDYIYFGAMTGVILIFIVIIRELKVVKNLIVESDFSKIINAVLE